MYRTARPAERSWPHWAAGCVCSDAVCWWRAKGAGRTESGVRLQLRTSDWVSAWWQRRRAVRRATGARGSGSGRRGRGRAGGRGRARVGGTGGRRGQRRGGAGLLALAQPGVRLYDTAHCALHAALPALPAVAVLGRGRHVPSQALQVRPVRPADQRGHGGMQLQQEEVTY